MKTIALLALSLSLCACVNSRNAGPYPNGFSAFGHHHYIEPRVGNLVLGSNAVKDPLATGYVVTDADGNVYVSPALSKRISRP